MQGSVGPSARLTVAERVVLGRLAARRASRVAFARALRSPALRWCLASPIADELHIVPQDPRTPDPSFLTEIASGQFGLAGIMVGLGGLSPFALPASDPAWARELHGFGWLRHLRTAGEDDARIAAQAFVSGWLGLNRQAGAVALEPQVVARRIISWLSHADLLLEAGDPKAYAATAESLGADIRLLSATWRRSASGCPRLLALAALVFARLCVVDQDRHLDRAQSALAEEIERQILPDGGHVSRNPAVLVELLLDFLPLRQCYSARQIAPPRAFHAAIERMISFLRFMRRGDGGLARFNGAGHTQADALATLLGHEQSDMLPAGIAADSRYCRLECGQTVIIADVGTPPPLEFAGGAHAGCLAFEISAGPRPLLMNCGAAGPGRDNRRWLARATASHNTLSPNNASSSRLVGSRSLDRLFGGAALRLPDTVTARVSEDESGVRLDATHDGYLERFGLLHGRSLSLTRDGRLLAGTDRLMPPAGILRLRRDLPFAIHFHVPWDAICRGGPAHNTAEIQISASTVWRMTASGARLSIEESVDYASPSGPRRSMQIVLRGACPGETQVDWTLEQAG